MIELYGAASPNVFKVSIMLEEVGLPYQLRYVDVFAEEQYRDDFLKISPTNKVPAILDTEGPGRRPMALCESGAILVYLAEKTGKLLSSDPETRATTIQWLMIQMASIGPMFGQYLHFLYFAKDVEYGLNRYQAQVRHLLALLDTRLAHSEWIGGTEYSVADVATLPWIRRGTEVLPWLVADAPGQTSKLCDCHPHLHRWYEAAMSRPATRQGIERLETLGKATSDSFSKASGSGLNHFLLRS